jgi:hypothetical protein
LCVTTEGTWCGWYLGGWFEAGILAGHFLASVALQRRRPYAPELPGAEKTVAAGVATVGRKAEPALHRNHRSGFHALARDVFEVEVSAARAMRVSLENRRHAPTMEPVVTGVASPGPQAYRAEYEIAYAPAVRSKTIYAAALRTNHCHPVTQGRRIPKTV